MADKTKIQWTDASWNPLVGCTRVSAGCTRCYAERLVHRGLSPQHRGLTKLVGGEPRWTGEVRLVESALTLPTTWTKPRRVFVNSMSDLFHESLPVSAIAAVFEIMREAPRHTFQVLTKRAQRMRELLAPVPEMRLDATDPSAHSRLLRMLPLPNVWLGVSAENQATFDERVPLLAQTPAAVRFVSAEPLLEEIDAGNAFDDPPDGSPYGRVDWLIVGGESGPGARPFELAWARDLVAQCRAAGVAAFVKQAGSRPLLDGVPLKLQDRKGGELSELPAEFHVREFPRMTRAALGEET